MTEIPEEKKKNIFSNSCERDSREKKHTSSFRSGSHFNKSIAVCAIYCSNLGRCNLYQSMQKRYNSTHILIIYNLLLEREQVAE